MFHLQMVVSLQWHGFQIHVPELLKFTYNSYITIKNEIIITIIIITFIF